MIDAEEFTPLITELTNKVLPNNFDRKQAGFGKSQTFGIQTRWSYIPWLGRMTWKRPRLWQLLLDFAEKHIPDFDWDAITVNDSYMSAPHKDKHNEGDSLTITFGDFTGGELMIEDPSGQPVAVPTRHSFYRFNGATTVHWTAPFQGRRFCLVFYRIKWPPKYLPRFKVHCQERADGMEIHCGYDGSIVVLDKNGHLVRTVVQPHPKLFRTRLTKKGQPTLSDWALTQTSGPVFHLSVSSPESGPDSD